ncbi:MAG: hypothetical protein AAGK14_03495 [Verrucomicrobiota bacterium]
MNILRLAALLFLLSLTGPTLHAVDKSKVPGYKNDGEWITVISPVTPQTWSTFSIERHLLEWKASQNTFQCRLTLTNELWDGDETGSFSPERETFFIPFPRVKPIGDGKYGATNADGNLIPLCRDTGGGIELLPTTRVNLFSFSGRLVIVMLGTTDQGFATTSGDPWVIYHHGFHLQNLIQNKNLTN